MKGFVRRQEERLAVRLLEWRYQKMNIPMLSRDELEQYAAGIVDDAHRIARERGLNVMSIIKEMISDIKKR